jgi:hypothetical protein
VAGVYEEIGWFGGGRPPYLPYPHPGRSFGLSEGSCFIVFARHDDAGSGAVSCTPLNGIGDAGPDIDCVISGAAAGPQDRYERDALVQILSRAKKRPSLIFTKAFFGETFSTGAMLSTAVAWDILQNRASYPGYPVSDELAGMTDPGRGTAAARTVCVLSADRNGSVGACLLSK